jgi:hypothetical protein
LDTVDVIAGSIFTTTLKPMPMTVFRFKQQFENCLIA